MGFRPLRFNARNLRGVKLSPINRVMNAVDLASLLCSRLCHDLMSPVGALNNGIELLADEQDPEMREKCLELLAESARASANKLKFFRLAFGAAGGFADNISFFVNVTFPTSGRYIVQTLIDSNLFEEQLLTISDIPEQQVVGASEAVN